MMKAHLFAIGCMASLNVISAAYADNASVENAIKGQPDLSSFYQLLVDTGVNHELKPDKSYTVFAPTNEILAETGQDKYPCFYKMECRAQVAAIIRNHIIPGKIHIEDAVKHEGGLFSIGDRMVNISEPSKEDYAVDDNNILSMSPFNDGVIYKIDGVIINPHELVSLENAEYMAATYKEMTIVSKKTIPDPACGSAGCPDAETTTVIRAVSNSVIQ